MDKESAFIHEMMEKVISGSDLNFAEAERLIKTTDLNVLTQCADNITRTFNGNRVDVESLINAKSGNCPEDCHFCSQSSHYKETGIKVYPLLPREIVLERAKLAQESGSKSFCLVCAYKSPPDKDFDLICEMITEIKNTLNLDVNASLGSISREQARRLKTVGVKRYNHNLETSESYFSHICNTHDFGDRFSTAKIVKEEGLELCCGGIIGMGEDTKQRLELAFSIKSLEPDEIPLNILMGRTGTPLALQPRIDPMEAIRTIAVWRFIVPKGIIKIAGGRELNLKDDDKTALKSGANGIITGGYLTVGGNTAEKDAAMIKQIGLTT
ncbi:MAG TPA: biotin synthase BioB [Nitrososphaeraceae archaeon]|jgi:biotin synthase